MLASNKNIQRHFADVERLLEVVCGEDEFPWFVSDETTVFDVSTATDSEIRTRLVEAFGQTVTVDDLKLPLWLLALRIVPRKTGGQSTT